MFKKSILPAIKTLCERANLGIQEAINKIIKSLSDAEKISGEQSPFIGQMQQLEMIKNFSDKKDHEVFEQQFVSYTHNSN